MSEMWLHKAIRGEEVIEAIRNLAREFGYEVKDTPDYLIVRDTKNDLITWLKFMAAALKVQADVVTKDIPAIEG